MSSHVFYRFRSQKEPSRISFDGTGISVWDLKKEIILENKMGKGADFDFAIYNADTEEEYTDHQIVPRSTSVLARRLPPARPGRGNAQDYMVSADSSSAGPSRGDARGGQRGGVGGSSGGGGHSWNASQFSKRFDGREESKPSSNSEPIQVTLPAAAPADEASALAAMFAQTSAQWQETQEQMANQTPIRRPPMANNRPAQPRTASSSGPNQASGSTSNGGQGGASSSSFREHKYEVSKPTPPGYICYRCGQKGHWIQECPTNTDQAFDNRPKIKRTTGIPKSFLQEVEGPIDSATADDLKSSGVMITAEGGFVIARPDQASWLAHRAITKNLTESDVQNLAPTDPDLTCPICSKLLKEAVMTPCCSTSFCRDCVENALADNDMMCPECETRVKSFEKLKVDQVRRDKVQKYIQEVVEASKEAETEELKQEEDETKVEAGEEPVKKEEESSTSANGAKDEKPAVKAESVEPKSESKEPTPQPLTPSMTNNQMPSNPQLLQQQIFQLRQQLTMSQMQLQQMQAQMFQLSTTAQNPRMAPMMRMQAQGQAQQAQMMIMGLMQGIGQQQMMLQGLMARAGAMNGNGPMMMNNGQMMNPQMNLRGAMNGGAVQVPTGPKALQQQQPPHSMAPIPTGPKSMMASASSSANAAATSNGTKREAPADFKEDAPESKKANLSPKLDGEKQTEVTPEVKQEEIESKA